VSGEAAGGACCSGAAACVTAGSRAEAQHMTARHKRAPPPPPPARQPSTASASTQRRRASAPVAAAVRLGLSRQAVLCVGLAALLGAGAVGHVAHLRGLVRRAELAPARAAAQAVVGQQAAGGELAGLAVALAVAAAEGGAECARWRCSAVTAERCAHRMRGRVRCARRARPHMSKCSTVNADGGTSSVKREPASDPAPAPHLVHNIHHVGSPVRAAVSQPA
jgi:hypothetical protein